MQKVHEVENEKEEEGLGDEKIKRRRRRTEGLGEERKKNTRKKNFQNVPKSQLLLLPTQVIRKRSHGARLDHKMAGSLLSMANKDLQSIKQLIS